MSLSEKLWNNVMDKLLETLGHKFDNAPFKKCIHCGRFAIEIMDDRKSSDLQQRMKAVCTMNVFGYKCNVCGEKVDMLNTHNGECKKTEDGLHVPTPIQCTITASPSPPLVTTEKRTYNATREATMTRYFKVEKDDIPRPTRTTAEEAVRVLLRLIGRDPEDPAVKETPRRVVDALWMMTTGQYSVPEKILGTVFEETGCDEMVILKDIPFSSLCEHHLLPFTGTVDIGYLPSVSKRIEEVRHLHGDGRPDTIEQEGEILYRIVGLSKLARLVDCFSQRSQVQERMTRQIAEALMTHLKPQGVGVVVRGEHTCMSCRGVKKAGTTMITSSMLGLFREDDALRSEFLNLCKEKT